MDACAILTANYGSGSIILWGCFAAGVLHKIDAIVRKEHHVTILKQHLRYQPRSSSSGADWSSADSPGDCKVD